MQSQKTLPENFEKNNKKMVLQKYLSMCSVASRRKAQEMILKGAVMINGKIAKLGDRVSPNIDKVYVEGQEVLFKNNDRYYIMLNKPRGYVTTMKDEKDRKCVADLVKDVPERVYPAGRLDKDSEGLLIMTNDGNFANNLIHPSKNIFKAYRVTIKESITEKQIACLSAGMEIDGKPTQPAKIRVISQEPERTVLEISIKEGRNRQIRKMCESVGLSVARLKRISIGKLKLGTLKPGKWRYLREAEINILNESKKNIIP